MKKFLETERLILRQWKDSDRAAFAAMSSDPEAMEFLGGPWWPGYSDVFIEKAGKHFDDHGYGDYAVELKESGSFIGFSSLTKINQESRFTPAVAVGWRLGRDAWGKGYATEAAQRLIRYAFNDLGLKEVISFCTVQNVRSIRIMEKLGMTREDGTFPHPASPPDDLAAEKMIFYRIQKAAP